MPIIEWDDQTDEEKAEDIADMQAAIDAALAWCVENERATVETILVADGTAFEIPSAITITLEPTP